MQNIITSIDYVDVRDSIQNINPYEKTNLALKNFERNPIEITTEVALNFIYQNNHKVAEIIIIDLTKHFQNLIKTNISTQKIYDNSNIAIIYCRVMRKIYDAIHKSSYTELVLTWYDSLVFFNVTASIHKVDAKALNELMTLTDQSFDPLLKIEGIDYLYKALYSYKESIFCHIFYNAPFWNDVQTGSPGISERRGQIFSKTSHYLAALWSFSVPGLYNVTLLSIDPLRKVQTEDMYLYLGLYKDFVTKNIGYNRSMVLRYKYDYISALTVNCLELYKNVYDRTVFHSSIFIPYRETISRYSPFSTVVIASCLAYDDEQIGSLLIDNYLFWWHFVISKNKNDEFVFELVRESISLLETLLWFREEIKNGKEYSELKRIESTQDSIDKILNLYLSYNYNTAENSIKIASIVNNSFWQLKEFNLKDIITSDDDLANKIDKIILETRHVSTSSNEQPVPIITNNNLSITKNIFNIIKRFFSDR